MGTTFTALLVHHCWKKTPTGHLLHTCIENQASEIGLYGLIWHNSFPVCTRSGVLITRSWLFHVCQFNNDHEIAINIDHATHKPKRLHDRAIIDVVQEFFDSKSELRAINHVRMLHGVVSLSDICTADGTPRLDNVFLSRDQFGGSLNDFCGLPNVMSLHPIPRHGVRPWSFSLQAQKSKTDHTSRVIVGGL